MAKMVVKRVGVFSIAKMQALIGFIIGLIVGVLYGVIFIIGGAVTMTQSSSSAGPGGAMMIGMGVGFMIGLPILYSIFSFIFGAIFAWVYNISARFVGGVELELESAAGDYGTPPAPPQWSQPGAYQKPY
jgi:hypothetical protein